MNSKTRAMLIALAVICFGVALSFPVMRYFENKSLDDGMDALRRMREQAAQTPYDDAAAQSPADLPEAPGVPMETEPAPGAGAEQPPSRALETDQSLEIVDGDERRDIMTSESAGAAERGAPTHVADAPDTAALPSLWPEGARDLTPDVGGEAPALGEIPAPTLRPDDARILTDNSKPTLVGTLAPRLEGARSLTPDADGEAPALGEIPAPTLRPDDARILTDDSKPTSVGTLAPRLEGARSLTPDAGGETPSLGEIPAPTLRPDDARILTDDSKPTPVGTLAPWPEGARSLTPGAGNAPGESAAPSPAPTPFVFDEKKILPEFKALYEENRDVVGWLKVGGTMIDYPVLQRDDQEYYLTRDFYGRNNANGQLVLEARSDPFTPSMNLVISGHNMKSGKMFGTLQSYAGRSFGLKHPIIEFDTLFRRGRYKLVAAFYTWDYEVRKDGFRYNVDIQYKRQMSTFMEQLNAIKLYDTGVEVEFGDELLMLSTCSYQTGDGRFVVVARRLRSDEQA